MKISGTFTVKIELGNSGMRDYVDIMNALADIQSKLLREKEKSSGKILDRNGNTCGKWELDAEENSRDDE